MATKKLPWFKAWVKDILADAELKCVPMAARGFWLYCMCLMHKSPRRGYLLQENGQPFPLDLLALNAGCSTDEAAHLYHLLLNSEVFSASEDGVAYSRRMVRESRISEVRQESGRKGGFARQNAKQNSSKSVEYGSSSFSSVKKEIQNTSEGEGGAGGEDLLKQNPSKINDDTPEWMMREFLFRYKGTVRVEPGKLVAMLEELARFHVGKSSEIMAMIVDNDRDKTQTPLDFRNYVNSNLKDEKTSKNRNPPRDEFHRIARGKGFEDAT